MSNTTLNSPETQPGQGNESSNETKPGKGILRWFLIGAPVLAGAAALIILGIPGPTPDTHQGITGVATAIKGKVELIAKTGETTLKIGDKIPQGTTIKTGNNALAIIQVPSVGLFRVLEKTKVSLEALDAKDSHFRIDKGGVFSNMRKLKSGQQFRISTVSAVAAVRGTKFLVMSQNKKPRIIVSEGSVALTQNDKTTTATPSKEVILTAGQTATLAAKKKKPAKFKVRSQTVSEKLNMQQFEFAKFAEDVIEKDKAVLAKDAKLVLAKEKAFAKKNRFKMVKIGQENLSPIDRLRKNGKPLTKLYLVGGEILIGFIETQDAKVIKLNTGDALITINKSDVIKREAAK